MAEKKTKHFIIPKKRRMSSLGRAKAKEHWKNVKPLFDLGDDSTSRIVIEERTNRANKLAKAMGLKVRQV